MALLRTGFISLQLRYYDVRVFHAKNDVHKKSSNLIVEVANRDKIFRTMKEEGTHGSKPIRE